MSRHVLVVDDDPGIRDMVCAALVLEQCQVDAARDGREAVAKIVASLPGVVLLDINMPVLDGPGVARELHERGIAVPIVVMTAARDAARWVAEIGADDVLAKPFDLDDLFNTVKRFVDCPAPADG